MVKELAPRRGSAGKAVSWEGGLAYRLGLELYRGLNRDAQVSQGSVINLISLCAPSAHTHRQAKWLTEFVLTDDGGYSYCFGVPTQR